MALSFLKKDGRILARGGVFVRLGEAGGVGRRALLFLPQILVVVVDVADANGVVGYYSSRLLTLVHYAFLLCTSRPIRTQLLVLLLL